MENELQDKIESISPEGEIRICPACGYRDGFHVSFLPPDNKGNSEIILICPRCHRRFRVGWYVHLAQA